jgi:hypothetical protein
VHLVRSSSACDRNPRFFRPAERGVGGSALEPVVFWRRRRYLRGFDQRMLQTADQCSFQVYSFVPIPGAQQHKRPRRRYEEIERMYKCGWNGCEKAYGTLNHLNAHVTMQSHGQKRTPEGNHPHFTVIFRASAACARHGCVFDSLSASCRLS